MSRSLYAKGADVLGIGIRSAALLARGRREDAFVEAVRLLTPEQRAHVAPAELIPRDRWHSWDPTPWAHPWLVPSNLRAAKAFGDRLLSSTSARYGSDPAAHSKYGFVGNLANNMALRALPLRRRGVPITIYVHPLDRHVMGQPGWELYDRALPTAETNVDRLAASGVVLPHVPDVVALPAPSDDWNDLLLRARRTPSTKWPPEGVAPFVRQLDALVWPSYFSYLPALQELQQCSALFSAQTPYLAYLSGRPYLAAQTGGDLWLDASRDDALGTLQRRSYARASAILATNPWAFAHARRFGFRHVLYVPLIIDTDAYAPGASDARGAWQQAVGGDFFALITARLDRTWKGSHVGIEGFARFARRHPGARVVVIGWGEHTTELLAELDRAGLKGRYVRLPTSGKRKLVEYLRGADCVIDQFVIGYYGATALEAMSVGAPVVMRHARDQYDALCPTGAPPILDATTPEDVDRQLNGLAGSAAHRQQVSRASRDWVIANHGVDTWRDKYVALLNAAAAGAQFPFDESPLAAPLSAVEREYHDAGLRAAPPFPQYLI